MFLKRITLNGAAEIVVHPGELCADLQVTLGRSRPPSAQWVGRLMKRLGFPAAARAAEGKRRVVNAKTLAELLKRYGEPSVVEDSGEVH